MEKKGTECPPGRTVTVFRTFTHLPCGDAGGRPARLSGTDSGTTWVSLTLFHPDGLVWLYTLYQSA